MAVEYLGLGDDDGTVLGRSSTDLIAFFGNTPTSKVAVITLTTASTIATVENRLQAVIAALIVLGLVKSA